MKSIEDIMAMAQNVQEELTKAQANLDTIEVEGASGGGLVKVTLNGKMEARGVKIDPSLMKPGDVEMLEDLLLAAFQDARAKAEQALQDKMREVTGGLPLPPGLKLF